MPGQTITAASRAGTRIASGSLVRTLVIINPAAGTADVQIVRDAAVRVHGWDVVEATEASHARQLATDATARGYERVVAAGGDGTINEVVQGLAAHPTNARLGVIPMGTGNDLARTLDLPTEPIAAIELIEHGAERQIDLIRVETQGLLRYCINVATGGFGGEVDLALEDGTLKETWGPLAYVLGAVKAQREMKPYEASIHFDDGPGEDVSALAIVVANGRTCAGGMRVAPLADPEDGLIDVMIIRHGTLLELAGVTARLAAGTIFESPHVIHRRSRRVHVESEPQMWFNVDGELITEEPATFTAVPKMIRVIVGPGYHRDPLFR